MLSRIVFAAIAVAVFMADDASAQCPNGNCPTSGRGAYFVSPFGGGGCANGNCPTAIGPVSRGVTYPAPSYAPSYTPATATGSRLGAGELHAHTCANGHTWTHRSGDPGASHNCPVCGLQQWYVDMAATARLKSGQPATSYPTQAVKAPKPTSADCPCGCVAGSCPCRSSARPITPITRSRYAVQDLPAAVDPPTTNQPGSDYHWKYVPGKGDCWIQDNGDGYDWSLINGEWKWDRRPAPIPAPVLPAPKDTPKKAATSTRQLDWS